MWIWWRCSRTSTSRHSRRRPTPRGRLAAREVRAAREVTARLATARRALRVCTSAPAPLQRRTRFIRAAASTPARWAARLCPTRRRGRCTTTLWSGSGARQPARRSTSCATFRSRCTTRSRRCSAPSRASSATPTVAARTRATLACRPTWCGGPTLASACSTRTAWPASADRSHARTRRCCRLTRSGTSACGCSAARWRCTRGPSSCAASTL
mmetsp:Transcript_23134/g.74416  ORF Transcript_23134/g.74416 Transcript_23134/m.74416 type:complete len:212 (+) Transcript_23134:1079-1714(+)